MKPFLLCALVIFMTTPMFAGRSKHDPTMPKQKAAVTGPKEPKISGMPAHHSPSIPVMTHVPKTASVDAQLNQLEKQDAKIVSGPAARKKSSAPTATIAKSSPGPAGNKSVEYKYHPPKNNTARNSSKKASPSKIHGSGYQVGH